MHDTDQTGAAAPAAIVDPRIAVRPSTLADGRELIYFDDADSTLPAERAIDERALDPRPATAHMRQDPLTGEWISIAAARQNRVFLPPADLDPLAPPAAGQPLRDPQHLRRRGLREPVAVVRPRARRTRCLERRRAGRPAPRRPRAHGDLGRPVRGRVLQPRARGLLRHAQRLARPHRDRGVGRSAPPRSRRCPASRRSSRSRTADARSASRCRTRTARSTRTPT